MKMTAESLPNDPNLLKQMVLSLQQDVSVLQQNITKGQATIERLELRLATLLRNRFGRSNERSQNTDQLDLLIEDVETTLAKISPSAKELSKATSSSRSRKSFSKALPREERRYEPSSCNCPDCGGDMKLIGEDRSEMLHVIPEQYVVIQQVRPKYGCSACDNIAQAPAQERVIDKGIASAALISQVIVDKYADHLPLYRQEERFKRADIDLDRSTLAG